MSAPVFSPVASGTVDSRLDPPDTLVVVIKGAWEFDNAFPDVGDVALELDHQDPKQMRFDTEGLETWHSGLVAFLLQTVELAKGRGIDDFSRWAEPIEAGFVRLLRENLVVALRALVQEYPWYST